MILKVGISGKRYIKKGEEIIVAEKIKQHLGALLKKYNTSQLIGYTGLAIGADTIFAKVVTEVFKQPLHVVLPFERREYEKDFNDDDLKTLKSILDNTKVVGTITAKIPLTSEERNEAYFAAGKYIVDSCDETLFVWDELMPEGRGGTAEVIGYYSEKKGTSDVFYIKTSPAREDPLNSQIERGYGQANKKALKFRDSYKKVWRSALLLGWVAVLIFSVNTAFPSEIEFLHWLAVGLEFLSVGIVYFLISRAKKRNFHGKYLKERIKAEKYRILRCYYHSNAPVNITSLNAKNESTLSETVKKINDSSSNAKYKSNWYANYVIKGLVEDQKQYHENKIKEIGTKQDRYERIKSVIKWSLFINITLHFIASSNYFFFRWAEFYPVKLTVFLNILLPASYAAIEGILYLQDWEVLKKHSQSVQKSLSDCEGPLSVDMEDAGCCNKQSELLNRISIIMLTDNENWIAAFENKSNYPTML